MNRKLARTAAITACLIAIFVALVVGWWRPGLLRGMPNDGHQLGGDLFDDIPGNTVEAFTKAIQTLEQNETYLYSEFDVRETSDGELVVFHDWDVSALPNTKRNREILGDDVGNQAICELTFQQIQSLELQGNYKIPSLADVLEAAKELKPTKPILVEVKFLQTDRARNKLLELVSRCRDESGLEIHFLAFVRNIKRSYPNPRRWLQNFSDSGFRVYQVYRPKTEQHDLCRTW